MLCPDFFSTSKTILVTLDFSFQAAIFLGKCHICEFPLLFAMQNSKNIPKIQTVFHNAWNFMNNRVEYDRE